MNGRIYRREDYMSHLTDYHVDKLLLDKIWFKKVLLVEKWESPTPGHAFVLQSDENGNIEWVKYEEPIRLQF